jgi:hypothetical protein
VYNHDRMPGRMDFFGQMWKEYALSDSRYIFCDPLLLCMEILSVVRLFPNLHCSFPFYFHRFDDTLNADTVSVRLVYVGPTLLPYRLVDHEYLWISPFITSSRLHRTSIQQLALLRNQSI